MSSNVQLLEHSLELYFFGIGMKTDNFSPVATVEFFKFAVILSAALYQYGLRILNSSVGIPSSSLALFAVMLPKTHLTSHSRMSGFR